MWQTYLFLYLVALKVALPSYLCQPSERIIFKKAMSGKDIDIQGTQCLLFLKRTTSNQNVTRHPRLARGYGPLIAAQVPPDRRQPSFLSWFPLPYAERETWPRYWETNLQSCIFPVPFVVTFLFVMPISFSHLKQDTLTTTSLVKRTATGINDAYSTYPSSAHL